MFAFSKTGNYPNTCQDYTSIDLDFIHLQTQWSTNLHFC